jgi:hypothetical protein
VALTRLSMAPLPRWPGWHHLPREARDTLFLLGVIGWTILPHMAHLAWWCTLLATLVLMWRARLALDNAPLPGRWTLLAVLMLSAVFTLITERTLLGKEAGVTMLVLLMVLKTLELRARRDALVCSSSASSWCSPTSCIRSRSRWRRRCWCRCGGC